MDIYLVGSVALGAGAFIGGWLSNWTWLDRSRQWELDRENLQMDLRLANERYLEALRREIANIIMAESPAEMERLYSKAKQREEDMRRDGAQRAQVERQALAYKYPQYGNFDPIGTRHIVTHTQADFAIEELSEAYIDISHWLAIEAFLSTKGKRKLFDDDETPVLDRVVRRETDTRLYNRIENAMATYYAVSRKLGDDTEGFKFPDFSVSRGSRQHTPEVEYWISFENPEEFGVYSFFSDGNRTFHSYYRASKGFQETTPLDFFKAEKGPFS